MLTFSSLRTGALVGCAVVLTVFADAALLASDLSNPVNPNAPSPNAGVAPGHRAAGPSTARRPGNLPKYGPPPPSSSGVDSRTP